MDGKGEEGWAEGVTLLYAGGRIWTEVSVKKECFWRITVPYERVDFWEVFLSFLKNSVSAYAAEGIQLWGLSIRCVVGPWSSGWRGLQLHTPRGCLPYLGGQEEFTEPWNEVSQADFSDKTSVGASYSNGSEVSVAFAKPMELGAIKKRPEVRWRMTICWVID